MKKTTYALSSIALAAVLTACGGGGGASSASSLVAKDPGTRIGLPPAKACTDTNVIYTMVNSNGTTNTVAIGANSAQYQFDSTPAQPLGCASYQTTLDYTLTANANQSVKVDTKTGFILPSSTHGIMGTSQTFTGQGDPAIAGRVYQFQFMQGTKAKIQFSADGTKAYLCEDEADIHGSKLGKCIDTTNNNREDDAEVLDVSLNAEKTELTAQKAGRLTYRFYKTSTDLGTPRRSALIATTNNAVALAVTVNEVATSQLAITPYGAPHLKSTPNNGCVDLSNYELKAGAAFEFTKADNTRITGTWTANAGVNKTGVLSFSNAEYEITALPILSRTTVVKIQCKTGGREADFFTFAN